MKFSESRIDFRSLHQQICSHFQLSELNTICIYLHIDPENIPGDTKDEKAREIIKFCYKNSIIPELLNELKKQRSNLSWDSFDVIYGKNDIPDEWLEPLQKLYYLVKEFNRNRRRDFSDERTRQADEIAFSMREAAPFLFNQFDIDQWLDSFNAGKRLAAIKYLEWIQDIDFLSKLLSKLNGEKPFIQFHILLAIYSMVDQVDKKYQMYVMSSLKSSGIIDHQYPNVVDPQYPGCENLIKLINSRLIS